jgi:flavin reductase (DIM6/NTAB) family NADH-FMN oxidoreductase RutF
MEGALAELPAIPADDFRAAMRGLASAVCVITSRHETLANGMTATAVCSAGLAEPLRYCHGKFGSMA